MKNLFLVQDFTPTVYIGPRDEKGLSNVVDDRWVGIHGDSYHIIVWSDYSYKSNTRVFILLNTTNFIDHGSTELVFKTNTKKHVISNKLSGVYTVYR